MGMEGIRKKLRFHIELNRYFAESVKDIPGVELALAPFLNFSCFRLQPGGVRNKDELNRLNEAFLDEINSGGDLFLTHTRINGLHTLRMIIGQTYVEEEDVERALGLIGKAAVKVLWNKENE